MHKYHLPEISTLQNLVTPCYLYDLTLLSDTLKVLTTHAASYGYHIHYAIKANANPVLLKEIAKSGLGADCVSGGEIASALRAGFPANRIVYAGVGKADWEIHLALDKNILCFNVESLPELLVINELAKEKNQRAPVALRINPDVPAGTHDYITTGLKENKFGIGLDMLDEVLKTLPTLKNIRFEGIHFHIGSQILDMDHFKGLCIRVNEIQKRLFSLNMLPKHLNMGGGLGINYQYPQEKPMADFASYFHVFKSHLEDYGQEIHFELGRSVIANTGLLLAKTLYVKKGKTKQFVILDAGMTELIRPALYHAYHKIENISNLQNMIEKYDVVGPICESSDCFAKDITLNQTSRGDLVAIYSAGAYGESMASNYNGKAFPKTYFFRNGRLEHPAE